MVATLPVPEGRISAGRLAVLLGLVAGTSGLGLAGAPVVTRDVVASLGLATGQGAWVVAAFSLGLAVTTPLFGRLGDLLGGRVVVLAGSAAAIVGCLLVLVAGGLEVLIAGRLLQGVGTAGVSIAAFAIPGHRLDGPDRTRVLGGLTAFAAMLLGAGPVVGAAISEVGGWRATLCASAIMLLGVPSLLRLATPPRDGAGSRPDVLGAVLVLVAAGAVAVLLQARATDMRLGTVVLVAIGGVGGAVALARHVRRSPDGFLPLRVLADRRIILPSLGASAIQAGYMAMSFLAPLLLTEGRPWGPLRVGAVLLPAAAAAGVAAHLAGTRWRRPAEPTLAVLALLSCAGIALAAVGHATPALVVLGAAGAACAFAGTQVALLERSAERAGPDDVGVVTGVFNLIFMIGGAVGPALAGGLTATLSGASTTLVIAALPVLAIPLAFASRDRRGGDAPARRWFATNRA